MPTQELTIFEHHGIPVVDSRDVAEMIGRKHGHVMRTISTMCKHLGQSKIGFSEFFIPATYKSAQGKTLPCYYLTEMGCDMVANKQTGEAGTLFTAHYVKAFHQMRLFILERQSPIWQDTRQLCKEVRRQETDAIKRLVSHAQAQGSRNAFRYYPTLSALADRTAGITDRDRATTAQLTALVMVERIIEREINAGIEAGTEYKTIYENIKTSLQDFAALTKAQ